MGKVDSIYFEGYDLWFHSSDHEPPHFHCAKTSEWEIKVFFLDCNQSNGLAYEIKWGRDPKGKVKRILNELVVKNRVGLLKEWEEKVIADE
jgi:hypothetical protein